MFKSRRSVIVWQLLFLVLATSWLWAPQLNHQLSSRTALISQYELPGQPYAWLFRLCDVLAAGLLIWAALRVPKKNDYSRYLLLIIGAGLLCDPLLSTTCLIQSGVCYEYLSAGFLFHAAETVITSSAILLLSIYDYRTRKRLFSAVFIIFQFLYGLLFVSQLATLDHFNTAAQYLYQFALLIWIAWYVRECLEENNLTEPKGQRLTRNFFAVWAFANGLLSILLSYAHLRLLGSLNGIYFANDNAWLAQHGASVGLIMLYLSRHLRRGERRARQIMLLIVGMESIKYAVITPHPLLLGLYLSTAYGLFVSRDSFNRGTEDLTWRLRLKEASFVAGALGFITIISAGILYRTHELSDITRASIDHFFDYTLRSRLISHTHIQSALLAHTLSALWLTAAALILWVLFRPASADWKLPSQSDLKIARQILKKYSSSTEDFFKVWPADKQYFFSHGGFISYKLAGPVAFALADPVAANTGKQTKLINEFLKFCRGKGWRACFLPVYDASKSRYESAGLNIMPIGASALIDMDKFLRTTAGDKWWRWQKNRAGRQNYTHHTSSPPHARKLVAQLKEVSDSWLGIEGRKERAFALGYFNKNYLNQCTLHYLTDSVNVVAFTNQVPVFRPNNTITVDMIRHRGEADGSMPFLILKAVENIKSATKFRYFDLGFVPFAAARDPALKVIKALSTGRFSAKGLEQFKNKFDPSWQPAYMAYDGDLGDLALIALNLEKAMDLKK